MFLPLRSVAAFCIDGGLAVLTGSLLSLHWLHKLKLRHAAERHLGRLLRVAAILMGGAFCANLYALASEFSDAGSVAEGFRQIPSIFATHMGKMNAAGLILTALQFVLASLRFYAPWRLGSMIVIALGFLLLRSSSGHAGAEGALTLSVALQVCHLGGMALWSGAILVSGFCIAPWLGGRASIAGLPAGAATEARDQARGTADREGSSTWLAYVGQLSRTSKGAVAIVLLSGLCKSYRTLGGHAGELRSGAWGTVLLAKSCCFGLALSLGALNLAWLNQARLSDLPESMFTRRSIISLRAEAAVMVLILALSAVLGNVDPPEVS